MKKHTRLLAALSLLAFLPVGAKALPYRYYSTSGYFLSAAPAEGYSSSLAQDLIIELNTDRARYGLSLLTEDPALTQAARIRAQEIVQKFSHTRPDGTSWSTVYGGAYAENIARGYSTAYKCEAALMSSSGHRANILRAHYTKVGVCAYTLNGVTYWVQLFGR